MTTPNPKGWYKETWREDIELRRKRQHWSFDETLKTKAQSATELKRKALLAKL